MPVEAEKRRIPPTRQETGDPLSVQDAQVPPATKPLQNQTRFTETGNQGNEKGVSEDRSLRLKTARNAVMAPSVSLMVQHGNLSISVDIGVTISLIVDTG